jgi:amino acid adenylation domain-containing protein
VPNVLRRLAELSPERRAAVLARLAENGEEFNVHPVSPGQRRLWLLDQLHPGLPVYNVPYAFRLRGQVDAEALGAALRLLGARHEALRTVFLDLAGEPRQVLLAEPPAELVVTDLPTPTSRRDATAADLADRDARTPFDLATGPLLRAELVRFAADDALLLVCLHHIICDGWSTALLFAQWRRAYVSILAGDEPALGPEPLQYLDFARWQGDWLRANGAARLTYWTERLAGSPPLLELPTDHPRPAVNRMRGRVEELRWPAGGLDEFCRAERVTPFMALLAAWNLVLYRYSGQDDLVVGTNVANRGRAETEHTVGFLVNTLALRVTVDPTTGFAALVRQVRDTTLAAQANQDVPFESVVDAVRPPRSTAHAPVCQTLVGMEDTERDILVLPGVDVTRVPSHSGTAKWDLELAITGADGEITGWLEYDSDLFEQATVRRLLGHLRRLLDAGIAEPATPVGRLPMLTDAEHEQVVYGWNPSMPAHGGDRLVHDLLADSADRDPDAVALVFEADSMTYRELDERANRLAHHLRSLGAGPDRVVGICLPRSLDLVVAMQAVLKSGAAYLPLDPAYPGDRLAYMLTDSSAHLVVTVSDLTAALPAQPSKVLLDDHSALVAEHPVDRPQRTVGPDALAYVIYTSGSTGRPKGVMVPHRGVVNLVGALREMLGTTPADRVLQFASFSFDVSVADIMLGLHAGATVVLAGRHDLQPGPDLARTIREQRVTTACLPPTVLRLTDPAEVPDLAVLMAGGEACPEEVATAWAPGRRFIDVYGPTETSIWVTAADFDGTGPLTIGRAVTANECYVLDEHLAPVPVGVPGELCIGGVGVCRGYLDRPDLTAERFVPDPFRPGRLYRTGDLVRLLPGGDLEYLHRMDDQVKVRGYRIEPGEIASVLSRHESVHAAVVTTREDVPGDVRLIAYLVAEDGHRVDAAELRAAVRRELPEYMVPAAFLAVPTIPRTPNGKLDTRALPAPTVDRPDRPMVAAGTRLERTIAEVWREVLRIDRFGAEDNFFDLGGNSLLLAKARSRLSETLDRDVPAVTLFTFPTVRALAAHLDHTATTPRSTRPRAGRGALLARRANTAAVSGE